MLPISEVYQDCLDATLEEANGALTIELYNRLSKLAELDMIDWISGDISAKTPPEPYLSQKDKDWLSPFITKFPAHAINGIITRPGDYYQKENLYLLGSYINPTTCEDEDVEAEIINTPIPVLDGDQFTVRQGTFIDGLEPTLKQPIAKQVGKTFEFAPKDIGSVTLEYIRYPKYGKIVLMIDPIYRNEVPDPSLSTNYEWDDKARPVLVWFIVDRFANRNSNQSQKQFNAATGKTTHG